MQFRVPQFLDIEDKVFGPFTFPQAAYLAGGGSLCYILYKLLGFWLGAIPIIAVASFVGALAFWKPNGKPFINMIESGFKYVFQDKLFIWKRKVEKKKTAGAVSSSGETNLTRENVRLNKSKLRDLAWSLDVLDMKKEEGSS